MSARRQRAVEAGHLGDVDAARALVHDPDSNVRASALQALERLGVLTDDEIEAAATDEDPIVRARACSLAANHRGVSLHSLVQDSDDTVAEVAAWAMGEQEDHAGVELLIGMAREHRDPLCREAAVAALGAIGDERGLAAILAGTKDKTAIRRRAVLALAPFEGPEVDAALAQALEDRDWQVRQAAEDLLGTE